MGDSTPTTTITITIITTNFVRVVIQTTPVAIATTTITVATTTSSRTEEASIEEEEAEGGVSEEDLLEGTRAGMLHNLHRRGYQVGSYATMTYGLLCYVCNK